MEAKIESKKSGLKRVAALIAAGVLTLGVALPASADHGHKSPDGYGKYRDYNDRDYNGDYDRPGRRYGKDKYRKYKKVDVYHHYPRPVKRVYVEHHYPQPVEQVRVEHHYYPAPEPRPVYVEPSYQEPSSGGYYQGSAGPSGRALVGAAVGGLLGSKVGRGSGKLAATAAGTLAGFMFGAGY